MHDIAGLRNFAWILDVGIGHRGDVHQPVLVDPYIDKGAERGDVSDDTFENHAGLQIFELFHSLTEGRRLVGRTRITSGLLEFPQDVSDGRHSEQGIGECLRPKLAKYGCVADQPLQWALGCRENAPHDGIGFRVYARGIKRIRAVADAQKPCRKLESLGPEPRYLLEDHAGRKGTVRLTVIDNAVRQSFADAGDSRQQRRGRRVDVNPYGIDAILDHRIEGARKFVFAEIVLILADTNRLGIDLDQFGERVLKPPRDRDRSAQGHVQPRQLLRGKSRS